MEYGMENILQKIINTTLNVIKFFEEKTKSAKTIKGIKRSIQFDEVSCGAHCTYMILKYFNKKISIDKIKKKLGTDEYGTDEKVILDLFKKKGLVVKTKYNATRKEIKKAINKGWPLLITMYEGYHWVVIYGYSKTGVFVLDSALDFIFNEWDWQEFLDVWDDRWIAFIKDVE
jgi:ABC-type bacteriocin/lantibiotic exporter with double-glycine peptidase domain